MDRNRGVLMRKSLFLGAAALIVMGAGVYSPGEITITADLGADPTGNTDISSALTAAIATGRTIYIPPGTYLLSGTVTDPSGAPVDIKCAGPSSTTINMSGSFSISQSGAFTIPFSIRDCGFNMTGSASFNLSGTSYNDSQPNQGPKFDNDYFYIGTGYTGLGPVFNFSYVSSGNFIGTNLTVNVQGTSTNPVLNTVLEISGVSMNWHFLGNQWWDNINGSSSTNTTTAIFLNGSTGGGVQGTRIDDSNISGFSKGVYIGPNNNTVMITGSMLDQNYYGVYINGSSINDVILMNSYVATSANTNSGSSAVYIGAATNVSLIGNTLAAYNGGNYYADMTNATANQVSLMNNVTNGPLNNPNNVSLIYDFESGFVNILSSLHITGDGGLQAIMNFGGSSFPNALVNGFFLGGNMQGGGGDAEIDFINESPSSTYGSGFAFYNNVSGTTYNQIAYLHGNGNLNVLGTIASQNIVPPALQTLGTNPPASGTAYQWAGPGVLDLSCPVTFSPTSTAAATATLDIGSTSTPSTVMDNESEPAGLTAGAIHTLHATVPNGWYWEITASNATIGSCTALAH